MDPSRISSLVEHFPEIKHFRALEASFEFRVGLLTTPVRARVWLNPEYPEPYEFEVSHQIHTPSRGGPYGTSAPFASSVEDAVQRVTSGILSFYSGAIQDGHTPAESWLVPNPSWAHDPFA